LLFYISAYTTLNKLVAVFLKYTMHYVMLNHGLEWNTSDKRTHTLQAGLTYTYSTLADGRSCTLHCRSVAHASVHPWSYQPVIPLQTECWR